jgi:hypothetical protein
MPRRIQDTKVHKEKNNYQLFKISDSLFFCAIVAKLYFSDWTQ